MMYETNQDTSYWRECGWGQIFTGRPRMQNSKNQVLILKDLCHENLLKYLFSDSLFTGCQTRKMEKNRKGAWSPSLFNRHIQKENVNLRKTIIVWLGGSKAAGIGSTLIYWQTDWTSAACGSAGYWKRRIINGIAEKPGNKTQFS